MVQLEYGKRLVRREDHRLARGEGCYTADLKLPNMVHAVMVRSPEAHARVVGIDASEALGHEGVVAVLTGADAAADGFESFTFPVSVKGPDGQDAPRTPRPFLVSDIVRYAGEPVAIVIAETLNGARDAAEAVMVEYEHLASITTVEDAARPGAVAVWNEAPDNVAFAWAHGEREAVEKALSASHHVTILESVVSRVAAMPLEPRAALGYVDPDGVHTLYTSHQSPHAMKGMLANALALDPENVRIVAPDVGGSFGMKSGLLREEAIIMWAARRTGRPVRWVCDRGEAFLSDEHGRDVRIEATLGLDGEGSFTALRIRYRINVGAYLTSRSASHITNFGGIAGVYRTPLILGEAIGVFTNTQPTAPYRGAGRPDATYAIERVIDVAATELGIDRFELRRRNLIPAEAMPFQTGFLFDYDCGDFAENMAKAAEAIDYAGFEARREASWRRQRLRGLGIANPIEVAAGPFRAIAKDHARVEVAPDGTVTVIAGAMSTGQGLETSLSVLVAQSLGIPAENVRYLQGDTALLANGKGSGGSAALATGGSAVVKSVEQMIVHGREIVAEHCDWRPEDVEFSDGVFRRTGSNVALSLAEVADIAASQGKEGLSAETSFTPPRPTYPNGCHICEVEVDPETGLVDVLNYVSVEDVGRVMNPLLVEGQIHGGVAQGIGQAIKEQVVHDKSGQLLTGSFMDYGMPLASDMPAIRCESVEVPTAVNPLGVKGVGEAGTVGALAAAMNAVCDALAPLGIRHIDMPTSSERLWRAIQSAQRATAVEPS
ncbi:xanthine dehydrogenase family protein molybdopterin-binding subunit [Faunimonas sp. B44]|uniref:xanthine dehydrogenase family protein molybdopterin-binding subunit n=1 Tax=Faunimonas sp. B44 TaxID=3461493 RepID=UPI00404395B1